MNNALRIGLLGIGLLMLAGCTTYYQPRYGDGGVYYDDGPYYSDGRYSRHTSVAVINPVHYPYWSLDYFYFSRHYHPYSVFVGYHEPFYYPYPGWAYSYRPYRPRVGISIGFGDPWFGYPWHGYGLRFQPGYYGYFSYPIYSSRRYAGHYGGRYYPDRHPVRRVDARLRALEQREVSSSRRALLTRQGGSAYGSIGRPGSVRDGQAIRSADSRSGRSTGQALDRVTRMQSRGEVSPRAGSAGRAQPREAITDRRGQVQRRVPDRSRDGRSPVRGGQSRGGRSYDARYDSRYDNRYDARYDNRSDPRVNQRLNQRSEPDAGIRVPPARRSAPMPSAPRPASRPPVSAPRSSVPPPSSRPAEPRRSSPRESAPRRSSPPPRSRGSSRGDRSRSTGRLRDRR